MKVKQIMTPRDLKSLNQIVGAALFDRDLENLLLEKQFAQVAETYDVSDTVWAWLEGVEIYSLADLSKLILDQWTHQINSYFWPDLVEIADPEGKLIFFEQQIMHAVA